MIDKPQLPPSPQASLDSEQELILAQPVEDGVIEDFPLQPPDCPSREQFSRGHEPIRLPELPLPPRPRFQFSMSDLMIVTLGVATGLAGGTWISAELFAAVLGLVTLIGLVLVHVNPPDTHFARLLWGTLVMAYVIAVAAAVVRSW